VNGWRARAAILALAYVAVARGVGNLYPWSNFEMYGATRLTSASRIAVRVQDGDAPDGLVEIERFSRWRCEAPLDVDPRHCVAQWPYFHVEARDLEVLAHIDAAGDPGDAGRAAVVVRRVWRLGDGPAQAQDCELARCEVAP
jgi:hypothetical protein